MPCTLSSGVMTLARTSRALCLAGATLGLVAGYACSLNPQPLPPGDTADSGRPNAAGDASMTFGGTDSGAGLGDDAGHGGGDHDASFDGAAVPAPEGGDSGNADAGDSGESDGPVDGATDAPEGGPTDAPTDGEEGGE